MFYGNGTESNHNIHKKEIKAEKMEESCILIKKSEYNNLKESSEKLFQKEKEHWRNHIHTLEEEIGKLKEELEREKGNIKVEPMKIDLHIVSVFPFKQKWDIHQGYKSKIINDPYLPFETINFSLDEKLRTQILRIVRNIQSQIRLEVRPYLENLEAKAISKQSDYRMLRFLEELPWWQKTGKIKRMIKQLRNSSKK